LNKGPNAFRTISEAAEEVGTPQHVLRFWETKFSFLRPMKRAGGRRFYRPQDIAVLKGVKTLLYSRGYKIEGVQRLYREQGLRSLIAATGADVADLLPIEMIHDIEGEEPLELLRRALADVEAAKAKLDTAIGKRS
jgi:DNA-binding transcriptional MerR regulator